jgi:hypothetical protein
MCVCVEPIAEDEQGEDTVEVQPDLDTFEAGTFPF